MQERKEIREMFEKKHKLLAKEHALRNAIQFMGVLLKERLFVGYEGSHEKQPKISLSDLIKTTVEIAKEFEAYIRGEDFLKENLDFKSAGDLFEKKRKYSNTKNPVQNKRVRKRN
ncbi:MAG: hypothetical protein J7L54_05535 [Elusimicrobia bacterium]|nr:hypothetical protein [Elusimicrobiota bacterium]